MTKRKKIVIIGTRRSGTTFIGKLLQISTKNFIYIEEPLNPVRGITSIDHIWYPYITNASDEKVKEDIWRLFNLKKVRFKNSIVNDKTKKSKLNTGWKEVMIEVFKNESKEQLSKRLLRAIFKSNHYLSYLKARISIKKDLIFKDALMSFSVKFILDNVQEAKAIFIYRNPLGFYYSMKRLNWALSHKSFLKQKELIKDYPFINELPCVSLIDRIINEWIIVNRVVIDKIKNNKRVICVSHEKLSIDPLGQIKKIVKELSLETDLDLDKIVEYTTGKHISNRTKDVKRNSKNELNTWKNKITPQEIEYIQIRTQGLYNELEHNSI